MVHKSPLARTVLAVNLTTFGQKTTLTTLWLQFKTFVAKGHLAATRYGWDIDAGPPVGPSYLKGAGVQKEKTEKATTKRRIRKVEKKKYKISGVEPPEATTQYNPTRTTLTQTKAPENNSSNSNSVGALYQYSLSIKNT